MAAMSAVRGKTALYIVLCWLASQWGFVGRLRVSQPLQAPLMSRLQAPANKDAAPATVPDSHAVLEIGDTVTATVVSMDKMWVELSADGRRGRMHKADLSRVEVKHPMDVLRKGEEVRCFVKQFRKDFMALSMVDTFKDRLRVSQLVKGQVYDAKVIHVNERIGAFVDLGAVANGLIPLKTIPGTDKKDKAEVLLRGSPPGKEMQVRVVEVDVAKGLVTVAPTKPA